MGWDKGYEIIEATIEEKLWYFQESDDGGFKFLDTYPLDILPSLKEGDSRYRYRELSAS